MKTTITVDQFNELKDTEKVFVQNTWKPDEGDAYLKITKVKLPNGSFETHHDIDIIHEACAGELGEGVNILKKTDIDKNGTVLVKIDVYPLFSITDLILRLGDPIVIRSKSSDGGGYDVTFLSKHLDHKTIAAVNEALRTESADELCDALWRAYLVRLRS